MQFSSFYKYYTKNFFKNQMAEASGLEPLHDISRLSDQQSNLFTNLSTLPWRKVRDLNSRVILRLLVFKTSAINQTLPTFQKWQVELDSNQLIRKEMDLQSTATLQLRRLPILVLAEGIEPSSFGFSVQCSDLLSYTSILH